MSLSIIIVIMMLVITIVGHDQKPNRIGTTMLVDDFRCSCVRACVRSCVDDSSDGPKDMSKNARVRNKTKPNKGKRGGNREHAESRKDENDDADERTSGPNNRIRRSIMAIVHFLDSCCVRSWMPFRPQSDSGSCRCSYMNVCIGIPMITHTYTHRGGYRLITPAPGDQHRQDTHPP